MDNQNWENANFNLNIFESNSRNKNLGCFLNDTSYDFQHVFEFRDVSWFTQELYDVLAKYRQSLCIVSAPGNIPEVIKATSNTAYVRFHGKSSWYNDNYSDETLQKWKHELELLPAQRLYAFFNYTNASAVNNGLYIASLFGTAPQKSQDSKQMVLFWFNYLIMQNQSWL